MTPTPTQIEARIVAALTTIRDLWDDMLTPPAKRTGSGTKHGGGATLPDNATSTADTPRTTQVIDARREIMLTLRSWCQALIEDHHINHGIPLGTDVPGMTTFLTRWAPRAAEHDYADDLADEIDSCRSIVERCARPDRITRLNLGACPLTWQDPNTAEDKPCPGQLRPREDGWVTCTRCGTRAVFSWWEEQVFGNQAPTMTRAEVVDWVHRMYGIRVTERAVRGWVDRGDLVRTGTDDEGRAVYDRAAVDACIARRMRRPGIVV